MPRSALLVLVLGFAALLGLCVWVPAQMGSQLASPLGEAEREAWKAELSAAGLGWPAMAQRRAAGGFIPWDHPPPRYTWVWDLDPMNVPGNSSGPPPPPGWPEMLQGERVDWPRVGLHSAVVLAFAGLLALALTLRERRRALID